LPVVGRYVPGAQSIHLSASVAPGVVENLPGPQLMQTVAAEYSEYLPRGHDRQKLSALFAVVDENFPILHGMHCDELDAALVSEYVPAAHAKQSLSRGEPVNARYLPATHSTHVA